MAPLSPTDLHVILESLSVAEHQARRTHAYVPELRSLAIAADQFELVKGHVQELLAAL